MDFQHAISVPTKQPAERGGGGSGKILRDGRRQSSDSVGSFDVAASLFSSMQALERSGRSFSSLLTGGSTADLIGLPRAQAAPANMRGRGFPVGGQGTRMSIGESQNNFALPSNNFMQLYPSTPMGRSLSYSDLDMEALLLQQQQRKLEGQLFQAPQFDVAGGRGGYLPSASRRGSVNSVDDFTTQELISELSRRRSERSRASAALNMLSAENQPRVQSTNTRRRSSASTDSLDLLANTANVDVIKDKGAGEESTEDKQKTNPSKGNVSGTLAVMDIATHYNPSKKRRSEEKMQSDASDSEDEAGKREGKKAKRNPSTSSIDILLTALNDDFQKLEEKDKRKEKVPKQLQGESADESQRRLSKESLLSNASDDLICLPVANDQDDLARNRNAHLALLLNSRPSLTTASLASESDLLYPTQEANFDYARRFQLSNSMMASLEYSMLRNDAMLRNDFAMRQLAMRDMQQREITSRLVQSELRRGLAGPQTLPGDFLPRRHATPPLPEDPIRMQQRHPHVSLPSSGSGNMASSNCDKSIEDKEGNEMPPNTHSQKTVSPPLQCKKAVEEPVKIPPKEALMMFLKAYGEKGENSRDDMLKAIGETERSLAIIHSWDRSQGLRKCHSRTVVKTRRSRAMIKAFLTGVEAPKEPHRNRKRSKKNNKKASDGFGAPLRHW